MYVCMCMNICIRLCICIYMCGLIEAIPDMISFDALKKKDKKFITLFDFFERYVYTYLYVYAYVYVYIYVVYRSHS
jgi:hypothetical protein